MWDSLFFPVAVILLVILTAIARWKEKSHPPGPFPWPFVGNQYLWRRLSRKLGSQHLAVSELCRQYRSNVISLRLGTRDTVFVSGVKTINEVLHNEDFDGRPWNEFIKLRNMGVRKGITMNDGPEWKDVRSWVVRSMKNLGFGSRKMLELIQDEAEAIMENLKEGGVHTLAPMLAPTVVNVLWSLCAGKRLSEDTSLQYFMNLMDRRRQGFDMAGGVLSTFPWIRYIAPETSGYNLLLTLNKEIQDFLLAAVEEHKKTYVPGSEKDLIDMFFREMYAQKASDSVFTEQQLVTILMDIVIAGSTTTTSTLSFAFLHMVIHQDVQCKLHEEIDRVIGRDRFPNLEDKARLPYTEAVLSESQRLWFVAPLIGPRRVLRETKLEGYTIPKNTSLLMNVESIHRNPDIFPEPDLFKPERFLKDGDYQPDENVIFFGKGKRRCPGEALARSALFLIFVSIMQKYKLLPVPGQGPPRLEIVPGMTIEPKPYQVLTVPR